MRNEDVRRELWVVGKVVECVLEYFDGENWVYAGSKTRITVRDCDAAIGIIESVNYFSDGKPTNGWFNGKTVTLDVPLGRAHLPLES